MIKQTLEQRLEIKEILKVSQGELYETISIIDDTTSFTHKETQAKFTCIEVQLKGCLIENGLRRRYVSYVDLENYEVSN